MTKQSTLGKQVLVVEDDPDFSALIASVLRQQGHGVTTASNGELGLKSVREGLPDAITLDLQMPGKSGLHFYREMKSQDKYRDIPVIVITGITRDDPDMDNFARRFLEVDHLPSPDAYLEKPFNNEKLAEVINGVLSVD